jgi:hypothetical protein
MRIKNEDWKNLKKDLINVLTIADQESTSFDFPISDEEDFSIFVNGQNVSPIFVKKNDLYRVEYDFTLCDTKIRTLSFSKYLDAIRIELTIKN